jgi:hypothetical protein
MSRIIGNKAHFAVPKPIDCPGGAISVDYGQTASSPAPLMNALEESANIALIALMRRFFEIGFRQLRQHIAVDGVLGES